MLNHITIMGRLTRDPELRYTQSQTPVASFTLAVDRDFGSRDGGKRRSAEVVVDNMYFGESRRRDGDSGDSRSSSYSSYGNSGSAGKSSAPAASAFAELDDGDGELPF